MNFEEYFAQKKKELKEYILQRGWLDDYDSEEIEAQSEEIDEFFEVIEEDVEDAVENACEDMRDRTITECADAAERAILRV